jgi:23S rRNA pseudouridine1911/1915/1917 synthase
MHDHRIQRTWRITHPVKRLDQWVTQQLTCTRACVQRWIRSVQLLVNQQPVKCSQTLNVNDVVTLNATLIRPNIWLPEPILITLSVQDPSFYVVYKPAGLVTHPAISCPSGTLVNALIYIDPTLCCLPRAGLMHRLDKNTAGLLLVARTQEAYKILLNNMKERTIGRIYDAWVMGHVLHAQTIQAPIGRHPTRPTKQAVIPKGKTAITHIKPLHYVTHQGKPYTWLRITLETGRMHQIRVHMAFIKHPVVGDLLYGTHHEHFNHALHASTLTWLHPVHAIRQSCTVNPPASFYNFLKLPPTQDTSLHENN